MRIVFVMDGPPSRLRPRPLGFVTELARRHDATVVCLCHSAQDITDVAALRTSGIHVTPVFEEASFATARAAAALLGERSPQVAYYESPKLRTAVMDEVARGGVGVVHVDRMRAAGSIVGLPVPTVWDADECASLLSRLRAERGTHGVQSILRRPGAVETQRLRAHERRLLGAFRTVIASTDGDRAALLGAEQPTLEDEVEEEGPDTPLTLRSLAMPRRPASIRVLPTGVDVDYFEAVPRRRHSDRLVFTGNLGSHANIAAADALIREIMPRIWQERPDVHVTLAGAEPPRHVQAYARDERVTVIADAPDLRPYISGAYVALSPMVYGTGVRNGVLEAMAMGTPVVASENATAGIGAVPGRDLLVATSPDRFAQLVLRVLDDEPLWRSLSRSGRSYVERQHAWRHVSGQLEAVYAEVSGYNFTLASAGVPVAARATAVLPAE